MRACVALGVTFPWRGKIGLTKTKREKKHRAVSHESCSQQDVGQDGPLR